MKNLGLSGRIQILLERKIALFLALGGLWLMSPHSAQAQSALYTDRSLFNAALQSSSSFNFENLTPTLDPSIPFPTAQNIIVAPPAPLPARLTITGNQLFVWPQSYSAPGVPASSGNYVGAFDANIPMTISFPGGRNAFGADFGGGLTGSTFAGSLTFNLADGSSQLFQFTGSVSSWTFVGAVFSQGINSVVFDDGGPSFPGSHEERIDNVTYGIAVPEPTLAALLLVGGLSSVALGRKRG